MAIRVDFSNLKLSPPSWSGSYAKCKNCSRGTHCNVGGPIPIRTTDWADGFAYWYTSSCLHCGHGEQKNKYLRAQYLKRVGRFDPKRDL